MSCLDLLASWILVGVAVSAGILISRWTGPAWAVVITWGASWAVGYAISSKSERSARESELGLVDKKEAPEDS